MEERIIKSVDHPNFTLSIYDTPNGYKIRLEQMDEISENECIKDYKTVSFLFDLKLMELEGH